MYWLLPKLIVHGNLHTPDLDRSECLGSSDLSNTQDLLHSPAFLTYCSSEVVPRWLLPSSGFGQASQKAEGRPNGQINEQSGRKLLIFIQVLRKCLSTMWWKGLDLGPEGESGSTCLLPPAAGGLENNAESERQWHVGGSWLQLTENRPFVLFKANVFRAHTVGAAERGREAVAFMYACLGQASFFLCF
jgi:hypothetical protein